MLELLRQATEPRFGYSANSGESSEVLILHQSSTDGCTSFLPVGLRMESLGHHQEVLTSRRAHLRPILLANLNHVLNGWCGAVAGARWAARGTYLSRCTLARAGSMDDVIPSRVRLCREVEASRRRQIQQLRPRTSCADGGNRRI